MLTLREVICSQYPHCLSCPLSVAVKDKDCRELSPEEIRKIMKEVRENDTLAGSRKAD